MDMKVGREMCIEIFELFLNTLLALGREHVLNEGKYFFLHSLEYCLKTVIVTL